MQQHGSNYFACRPPSPSPHLLAQGLGQKVKIQLFQNMVMLHIKLKGMTNAAICKSIFIDTLNALGEVKGQKHFFFESSHISYQINGNGT